MDLIPQAGANVEFAGINRFYKLVSVTNLLGSSTYRIVASILKWR